MYYDIQQKHLAVLSYIYFFYFIFIFFFYFIFFFCKILNLHGVYMVIQLKYGNNDQNQNRLFSDSYFRTLITPDCKVEHKVSAAL